MQKNARKVEPAAAETTRRTTPCNRRSRGHETLINYPCGVAAEVTRQTPLDIGPWSLDFTRVPADVRRQPTLNVGAGALDFTSIPAQTSPRATLFNCSGRGDKTLIHTFLP